MTRYTDLIRRGDAPDRIWIEEDDGCPYFYDASELAEAGGPLIEYIRADLAHPVQEPPTPGVTAGATGAENRPPFEFHRYINGQLMAEGVRIEKQATLEGAMVAAAKIASRGPNGEAPVLVLATPAPVVPILRLSIDRRIGMYGSAYDGPHDARAYTYKHQPGNLPAWKIGQAASVAAKDPAGDYIDRGLSLLRHLQDAGFGVFTLVDGEAATPAPVVPAEGPISTLEMVYRNMPDIPELPEAYQPRNIARSLAALRSAPPVGARVKPLAAVFDAAQAEAEKAMRKFPQPNYVISKVAEEAGEVVKAAIHCAENRETKEAVLGEVVQCMAMLIRLCLEGDQVHGLAALLPAGEGK